MNLSVLERMIADGDLSADAANYLVNCRAECEWLDYKEVLHIERDSEIGAFAKDVVGMKNTGGGYLFIGVRDKTWEPVGLGTPLPYDAKLLRDKVRRGSGLDLDLDIVHHDLHTPNGTRTFAVILVRSTKKRKKRRMPSLVTKDFCPREAYGLRRGDIYGRNGDSTVKIATEADLENLLDVLEAHADQDSLTNINAPSPFAIQDGTFRLLQRGFETFVGREKLRSGVLDAIVQDPRIWIINVHGPGGVGKSALINWATYELYERRAFDGIIQLTAKENVLTEKGIHPYSKSLYSLENLLDQILEAFQETTATDLEFKKKTATEILSAYKVLLVLDNMETVSDGRILNFVQKLPKENQSKVVLTSRQKTGGWELAIPVNELSEEEVGEFIKIKAKDLGVAFPLDSAVRKAVWQATGGLPLAIQWIIGSYKVLRKTELVLSRVGEKDSPILEFSFRNIWNVLSSDAKAVLAAMTVFDEPPTAQQISIATEWQVERIEKALGELENVTLVTRVTQVSDGRVIYTALPITLTFARHQLDTMGEFEVLCKQRYQKYSDQLSLRESELRGFRGDFERYGLSSENEKRAYILCQRGFSELTLGNASNADLTFRQARDLAPQSAYVLAMSASYEVLRNRIGVALDHAKEACKRATKKTGALCYGIKARVLDVQRDRNGRIEALEKALVYDPEDVVLRHQYGVALSFVGKYAEAVREFDKIIEVEKNRVPLRETMLMAVKTKVINLRKLGQKDQADKLLAVAQRILSDNPHLRAQRHHIAELEE
jgi:Flp pilus assembly protein TadD